MLQNIQSNGAAFIDIIHSKTTMRAAGVFEPPESLLLSSQDGIRTVSWSE